MEMFIILPSLQLFNEQLPCNTPPVSITANKTKFPQELLELVLWLAADLLPWRKHVLFISNNIIGIKQIIHVYKCLSWRLSVVAIVKTVVTMNSSLQSRKLTIKAGLNLNN